MNRILLSVFVLVCVLSKTLDAFEPDTEWTYKTVQGKALKLSVFLPDDYQSTVATKKYPAYVIFHGGSWRAGEANWHFPDCEYWSQRGMVAVSVDYRLKDRDNVEVPLACVQDAKSAIRFLRQHSDVLRVDPNAIIAAGGSAGGQLAAALATVKCDRSNDSTDDASVSCVPNAVVLFNPWFKCEAELSPPELVTAGLPPFITFLGDQDPGIPVSEIEAFHELLESKGNQSAFFVGKEGKHGFCNGRNPRNPFFYWSLDFTDRFLVELNILSGQSLVEWPVGVEPLTSESFLAVSKSMNFVTLPLATKWPPQQPAQTQPKAELPIDAAAVTMMDKNKDGKITKEEFLSIRVGEFSHWDKNSDSILSPGEHPGKHLYQNGDKDKDGNLNKEEYFEIFELHFAILDADNDGVLTTKDTTSQSPSQIANTESKLPISDDTVAKIDLDRNRRISKVEFMSQSGMQFGQKDRNKDNFLSPDEFIQDGLFLTSDQDLDGKLSKKEFLAICAIVFSNLDRDKDGELTPADTPKSATQSSKTPARTQTGKPTMPDHLRTACDVNKDDRVTREEFMNFRKNQFSNFFDKNGDQKLSNTEYTNKPSFTHADKDKDNFLTREEYLSIFRPHFDAMDVNRDGLITSDDRTEN